MIGRLYKNIVALLNQPFSLIPFTFYFVLFAVALVLANYWIGTEVLTPTVPLPIFLNCC
jgi:hypothetical protein